jgi:AcrR family transcriptional regulator
MAREEPAARRSPAAAEVPPPPRERILRALGEQAGSKGLRAVELEGLLEAARVSRAEFDEHFRGLDDCFLAAWDLINEEFLGRCMAAYAGPTAWRDKVRAAAEELLAFANEDLPRARVLIVELLNAGPKAVARRELDIRAVTAIIDAGRSELEDPESVPHMVANTIAGSIYQTLYSVLASGEAFSTEALMEELMYVAVMPYLGVDAALRELSASRSADLCSWQRMCSSVAGAFERRVSWRKAS